MRRYPTRDGICIPPREIELPESNLDIYQQGNCNRHHSCFTRRSFGRLVLYQTLRDLETQQTIMPVDVHSWLHEEYDPPRMPSPKQVMNELERAKDAGERLHMNIKGNYKYKPLTDEVMRLCIKDYDRLRR